MKDILLDSFHISGNGKDCLLQTAKFLDQHTEIKKVDLTMSYMYYYMDTDENGVATFAKFIPGDEYIVLDKKTGAMKANLVSASTDAHEFSGTLLNEIEEHPDDNGLIFVFDEEGRLNKPYVVSKYLSHTATSRFGPLFNTHDVIDAMQLAMMIGEMDSAEIYAVSRKQGDTAKLVGFFGTDCRRNLTQLVEELTSKACHVYDVKASQRGLDFVIGYYDEAEILDGYKNLDKEGYTPCYLVSTSDTGFKTDTVSSAWMDRDGQIMIVETVPLGNDPLDAVSSLAQSLKTAAVSLDRGYNEKEYFFSADEFIDYLKDVIGPADLGKKTVASLYEYAEEDYKRVKKIQKSSVARYSLSDITALIAKGLKAVTAGSPEYKKEKVNKYLGTLLQGITVKTEPLPSGVSRKFTNFDEFVTCMDWATAQSGISLDDRTRDSVVEAIKDKYDRIKKIQKMSYVQMDMARVANVVTETLNDIAGTKISDEDMLLRMLGEA